MRIIKTIYKSFILGGMGISALTSLRSETISGFVREEASGEPLSYVNVFIKDTYSGSTTTQDGYYVILNAPPGNHEVTASIIEYQMKTEKVSVQKGQDLRRDKTVESEITWHPSNAHTIMGRFQHKQLSFKLGMIFGGSSSFHGLLI